MKIPSFVLTDCVWTEVTVALPLEESDAFNTALLCQEATDQSNRRTCAIEEQGWARVLIPHCLSSWLLFLPILCVPCLVPLFWTRGQATPFSRISHGWGCIIGAFLVLGFLHSVLWLWKPHTPLLSAACSSEQDVSAGLWPIHTVLSVTWLFLAKSLFK